MKNIFAKTVLFMIFIVASMALCGCEKKEALTETREKALGVNEYYVYYLNEKKTGIMSKIYKSDTKDAVILAQELIEKINEESENENPKGYIKLNLLQISAVNTMLSLDFDEKYLEIQGLTEILERASIVLTLTQIEDVEFVGMTVNGQPIKDSASNNISQMKAADFVNFKDNFPDTKRKISLTLYYADAQGKGLKIKEANYEYDYKVSYEEFVVKKLIEGIDSDEYKSTLPENTIVKNVYTKDGVCYVDFDKSINSTVRIVSTELMIYSIVNSLSELSYVSRVQFSIEGDSNIKLYNELDLSTTFSRNLDLLTN